MTMINFKRTGGSIDREMTMSFDFDSMPGSIARRLQGLLAESNFFDVPVVNDLRAAPDEYQYDITVVAGNAIHTIHVSDTSMPQSIRPLVEGLTELAETAA
jgi:emfourin